MKSFRCLFLVSAIVAGTFLNSGCSSKNNRIIGVKIYADNNHELLIRQWKSTGINTAFISKELARDESFRKLMQKNKIPYFIIWPVFQNPEYLHRDTSQYAITSVGRKAIDDWVKFVCPSRRTYRNTVIDSVLWYVNNFHPKGISVDFIRHFVFWEMIYPGQDPAGIENACYCDSCLNHFSSQTGIHIPDSIETISAKATFLKEFHKMEWNRFRCDLITSMVKAISVAITNADPDVLINLHIVPWRENDFNNAIINVAGQNIVDMAEYADYISPMCYSQMLKRDPEWISSVVTDMNQKAPGKVLPSIQVYPYYIDYPFPPAILIKCLESSLKPPSNGVIFWSWPLLTQDPKRLDRVSDYLNNHH